jgi:endonuclease/exonuclease/phosphatase family metal-dependent hydrolase
MFGTLRRRAVALALALCAVAAVVGCRPPSEGAPEPAKSYLFCFWNVENLFDDRVDGWTREPDKGFDVWFADDKAARDKKLENLCKVLLGMNGGRGPDVLAVAEVESYRAAELLQLALNARLKDRNDHYPTVLYKDPSGGRSIACAILTRLKVNGDRTRLLGKRQRILEAHVEVDGRELIVIASHWASRLKDKGTGRAHYGDQIYGRYKAIYRANPKASVLVCGDFNDDPDEPSVVKHLHATGDLKAVKAGGAEPLLYNLFAAAFKKGEGTHYFGAKAHIFDQIAVSPGMLEGGPWLVDLGSAQIVKEMALPNGRPKRFGGRTRREERGASDHFPVTVRLHPGK